MPALVVGTGSHTYDVVQDFAILPSGMSFGHTNEVAVDSQGTVYVTQRDGPPVLVFDASGSYRGSLGEGVLADPSGICTTADDHIVVADRDTHQVLVLDAAGNVLLHLGEPGVAKLQAPFNHPSGVAVAPNGDILVADGFGNSCVHRFSADGRLIRSWGSPGAAPGEFSIPNGLWVDGNDRVYVADRDNLRLQVFDGEGGFLAEWLGLSRPMAVWGDPAGRIYVTDMVPRLSVFTAAGELLSRGKTPGEVGQGMCGDAQGNLYFTGSISGVTGDFSGVAKLAARA